MTTTRSEMEVSIRMERALYRAVESMALQQQRSVSQTARLLLEEALRRRTVGRTSDDDTPSVEIAGLAAVGGSFDWLREEPDLYDDICGEPV